MAAAGDEAAGAPWGAAPRVAWGEGAEALKAVAGPGAAAAACQPCGAGGARAGALGGRAAARAWWKAIVIVSTVCGLAEDVLTFTFRNARQKAHEAGIQLNGSGRLLLAVRGYGGGKRGGCVTAKGREARRARGARR